MLAKRGAARLGLVKTGTVLYANIFRAANTGSACEGYVVVSQTAKYATYSPGERRMIKSIRDPCETLSGSAIS